MLPALLVRLKERMEVALHERGSQRAGPIFLAPAVVIGMGIFMVSNPGPANVGS